MVHLEEILERIAANMYLEYTEVLYIDYIDHIKSKGFMFFYVFQIYVFFLHVFNIRAELFSTKKNRAHGKSHNLYTGIHMYKAEPFSYTIYSDSQLVG